MCKAIERVKSGRWRQRVSINEICQSHGISRQAYYKGIHHHRQEVLEAEIILQYIQNIRKRMPNIGTRKIHYLLQEKSEEIGLSVGRDYLFALLGERDLLIHPQKKYIRTTNSQHHFRIYHNLIKGVDLQKFQLVVSDITYLQLLKGFCYLALITDLYSRKIIGYDVSDSLSIEGSLRALRVASKHRIPRILIHHSDRGVQYCSHAYVELLNSWGSQISMAEQGNPYENAVAERVNGILKIEFLLDQVFSSWSHAQKATDEAIRVYNEERPHSSLGMRTPHQKYREYQEMTQTL